MKKSLYQVQLDGLDVKCTLCPHECTIREGKGGICRQRINSGGTLYSQTYGQSMPPSLDPIEKKPLYHFHPGTEILSLGTNGCNLSCMFCQNWHISQQDSRLVPITPELAVKAAVEIGSIGIAYTYNEPFIWFEFVMETSKLAASKGLKNVLVTNGFVNPEPLAELLPFISALNIDIKSMDDVFYRRLCKARVAPILETCETAKKTAFVEITNLVIPGENDSERDLAALTSYIEENLGPETPLHFSAYHPEYRMTAPPTPLSTLKKAYEIAKSKLHHVYLGNISSNIGNDTNCRKCGILLVKRSGFSASITQHLRHDGSCGKCGTDNNMK